MDDMTTVFILYDWTTNAILVTPITDRKDETMVKAFSDNVEYLTKRGFNPVFNIIGNVASKAVKAYLESKNIDLQLVEPHNHRVNAAERAIQTFTNHFIAGLSTCDDIFPTLLWNKLIQQCQNTL